MAAKKKPKRASNGPDELPRWVGVLKEHVSSEMKGFAEGMNAKLEQMETKLEQMETRMERRFESVERQLGLLTDAVRTHSKELQRIDAKLEHHERRITKLEGAAE